VQAERTSMSTILFVIFISIPIIEIALFIEVGDRIGLFATIGIVILTAIIGTTLIRHQGLATIRKAQVSLKENMIPLSEAFDGLCIIIAGALLLTPGFFTDILGLSLFIPSLRSIIKRYIIMFFARSKKFNFQETDGSVIDGEFENITDNEKKKKL
jgi:UPF0716 protein FxsA